jgi:UMF1 family MFS transporter
MGSIADQRKCVIIIYFKIIYVFFPALRRKRLLLAFAFLGASAAVLFLALPSTSPVWLLSAPLAVFANVGFGASVVAMNAYLPSLAQISPEVVILMEELENVSNSTTVHSPNEEATNNTSEEPLLRSSSPNEIIQVLRKKYDVALSNAISRISSLGIALGYSAGIILLILALIPVTNLRGSTFSLRLAIGLSGIWCVPNECSDMLRLIQ